MSYVVGALWWDRSQGVEQIAALIERREALTGGRFHATTVKIMQDGVAENGTAAMLEPYLDRCGHATDNRGHSFVDADMLRAAVRALDEAGFQVHVHAIGDRGVRETLDAMVGTDPARRHQIAHLQLIHPDDVPRFAALGVAANMQSLWACNDDQMIDLTLPSWARSGPAGSTRSGTSTAPAHAWCRAATGRCRRPTRSPRSTPPSRGPPTARPAVPARSRSCPSRR